jgi:hypothetical protein
LAAKQRSGHNPDTIRTQSGHNLDKFPFSKRPLETAEMTIPTLIQQELLLKRLQLTDVHVRDDPEHRELHAIKSNVPLFFPANRCH